MKHELSKPKKREVRKEKGRWEGELRREDLNSISYLPWN